MTNAFNDNLDVELRVNPAQVETLTVTLPTGSTDVIEVPLGEGRKYVKYFCEVACWLAPTSAGLTPSTVSADPAISRYMAVPELGGSQGGELKQNGEFNSVFVKPMVAPEADTLLYLILGDG